MMSVLLSEAEVRRRDDGVLLDTNLFILLCVGDYDATLIPRFDRTSNYRPDDYTSLRRFLIDARFTISTPNILSEVSNLLGHVRGPARRSVFEKFALRVHALDEIYMPSRELVNSARIADFGLTDLAIVDLCRSRYLVLTDDAALAAYLYQSEVAVVDFRRLRPNRHLKG